MEEDSKRQDDISPKIHPVSFFKNHMYPTLLASSLPED